MANTPPFSGAGNDLNNPISPAAYVANIEDNFTKIKDEILGNYNRIAALSGITPRVISVAPAGNPSNYNTIEDAIAAAAALVPAPDPNNTVIIEVAPGIYLVPGTQVVPSGVTIQGKGFPTVSTSTPTAPIFELANTAAALHGLVVSGASGAGGVGVRITESAGERGIVEGCVISGNETGIEMVSPDNQGVGASFHNIIVGNTAAGLKITNGTLYQHGDVFLSNVVLDLEVSGAAARFLSTGTSFNGLKTTIDPASVTAGAYISEIVGDESFRVLGEFSVGHPDKGARASFGKGGSNAVGMTALTNDNGEVGTWTDITPQLVSPSGSTAPLFPGTALNNTFYVGHSIPFVGLDNIITTAMVLGGGAVAVEYWNGAVWTEIDHLSSIADTVVPPQQFAKALWERIGDEHVRFPDKPGWVTKSLNGTTAYWIRVRITSAITTVPESEHMKLHFDSVEISKEGPITFFGNAIPSRSLPFSWASVYDVAGFASGNAQIDYSALISLRQLNNQFLDGVIDAVGLIVPIPEGLDTSRPLKFRFAWIAQGNVGDVEFQCDTIQVKLGDVLNGTLPLTEALSIIQTVPGTTEELTENEFEIDVSNLVPGEFLVITFYRNATAGNGDDTLAATVEIVNGQFIGSFWR